MECFFSKKKKKGDASIDKDCHTWESVALDFLEAWGGWHQNFEASNEFLHLELFVAKFSDRLLKPFTGAGGFRSMEVVALALFQRMGSHQIDMIGWWTYDLCLFMYIIYIHVIMIYYDIYIYICRLYILNLYLYTIYRIMSYTNTYKCRYWLAEASEIWEATGNRCGGSLKENDSMGLVDPRVHPTIILPLQWGGHTTPQTTPQPTGFLEKKSPAWQ